MDLGLRGSRVLITGGSRGIGLAIAEALVAEGAAVGLVARDAEGLATATEEDTACCYAVQDKVWVTGPGDEPWEVYVVKGDADTLDKAASSVCCAPADTTTRGTGVAG